MSYDFPKVFCTGLLTLLILSCCSSQSNQVCALQATDEQVSSAEKMYFDFVKKSPEELVAFRKAFVPLKAENCDSVISVFYERDDGEIESIKIIDSMKLTKYPLMDVNVKTGKGRFILFTDRPLSLPKK